MNESYRDNVVVAPTKIITFFAVHVHQLQHSIDWESARVWMTARGYWNRRTLEAIQIRVNNAQ